MPQLDGALSAPDVCCAGKGNFGNGEGRDETWDVLCQAQPAELSVWGAGEGCQGAEEAQLVLPAAPIVLRA